MQLLAEHLLVKPIMWRLEKHFFLQISKPNSFSVTFLALCNSQIHRSFFPLQNYIVYIANRPIVEFNGLKNEGLEMLPLGSLWGKIHREIIWDVLRRNYIKTTSNYTSDNDGKSHCGGKKEQYTYSTLFYSKDFFLGSFKKSEHWEF